MQGRIGIEIGGTFTDLVWQSPDGELVVHKVLSTPEALHEAVMRALDESGARLEVIGHVVHGSTVATNALLTRRGAPTGLLTTKGFRDVIEIGTHDRSDNVYEILYRKPRPPLPRRFVREVAERIRADGSIVEPIDLEAAWREVAALIDVGVNSIAICFLHSYQNAQHEADLTALVRERAPRVFVSASHEVSPEFREYERTMTTTVNALVSPVVRGYLDELDDGLGKRGFAGALHIMQSNGGVMPADAAEARAVRVLLSGPAAGVRGAMWFARRDGGRSGRFRATGWAAVQAMAGRSCSSGGRGRPEWAWRTGRRRKKGRSRRWIGSSGRCQANCGGDLGQIMVGQLAYQWRRAMKRQAAD